LNRVDSGARLKIVDALTTGWLADPSSLHHPTDFPDCPHVKPFSCRF